MTDEEKIEQAELECWKNLGNDEPKYCANGSFEWFDQGFKDGIKYLDENPSPKVLAALDYCEPHLDKMWAANIVGILLDCDFRNAKEHLAAWKDKR